MTRRDLFATREGPGGRRRTAPKASTDSDVRRMVGVLAGTVLAAIAVLAVVVATSDPQGLRAPGPLARPHAKAELACGACHDGGDTTVPVAPKCVGCHGPHASTRKPHRALMERGALGCPSCHRIHTAEGGVAIGETGQLWRYGPGASEPVALSPPGPTIAPTHVPVVEVATCQRCHDPARTSDPIQRCLLRDQQSLGDRRPTACFDEHRELTADTFAAAGSARERLAAWDVARRVLVQAPVAPRTPIERPGPLVLLGAAAAAALLGTIVVRAIVRRRDRKREAAHVDVRPPEVVRLPQINTATCIGCYACVDACPYDVLEIHDYVAQVARPSDCCGLTLCEQRCPNGSLVVRDGAPIEDRPRLDATLQSLDVPGVWLAGDLTGLPLIRNAINQGAAAVRTIAQTLAREGAAPAGVHDLVIVGAGPAGVSAALAAQEAGLTCIVLEQGSVAESIRSFPRGKLVFDQPLGIPLVGDLWLKESTKEELLGHWLRIVRQRQLAIHEQHRLVGGWRNAHGHFEIAAHTPLQGETRFVARRILLAIGRRGTARKLAIPVPDALQSRVHYSLADARSFAGQQVLVVGLGDVAMEAAIALARQAGTQVTISYRGDGFTRGKARNAAELKRLVEAGRVRIAWCSEVAALGEREVELATPEGPIRVPWTAMLVLIGALPPWELLAKLGIQRAGAPPPAPHVTVHV